MASSVAATCGDTEDRNLEGLEFDETSEVAEAQAAAGLEAQRDRHSGTANLSKCAGYSRPSISSYIAFPPVPVDQWFFPFFKLRGPAFPYPI